MFRYLKKYMKEVILAPSLKLFEASLELLVPLVVARIIDIGIENGDRGFIVGNSLFLVLFAAVGLAASVTAQYFSAKAAVGFASSLRRAVFARIEAMSFTELDRVGTSALLVRMSSDVNSVQTGLNLFLRLMLRSPFIVIGAAVMAAFIDLSAALIFFAMIAVLGVITFVIMYIGIPMYQRVGARLDSVSGRVRGNITGARVIRAFCAEDEEADRFAAENDAFTKLQKKSAYISSLLNPLTLVIVNLAVVILLSYSTRQVNVGSLTQGETVALYNYMSQILVELLKFANLVLSVTKSLASLKRLRKTLEGNSETVHSPDTDKYPDGGLSIEFRNVSMRYEQAGGDSLTGISFSVKAGQQVGIIGATGSGKTTLVNLLPRFYGASSGEILLGGKNINEYTDGELRRLIGYAPQKAMLFSGTLAYNMRWGAPDCTDGEIAEALRLAEADGFVAEKDGGINCSVEAGGKNFSGGQRQRLALARALITRAPILILDDTSSALDMLTEAKVRSKLASLDWSPTVLTVSQRVAAVRDADLIIVLDDGKLSAVGTHSELLETSEVYRDICESQR